MPNYKGELGVLVGLLGLLFVLFNPWNVLMPGYVVMALIIGAMVLFAAFAIFLWKENRGDERESLHRMFADRVAFLAGSGTLLAAIIIQESLHQPISPWIFGTLGIMILAKTISIVYSKIKL